MYALLVVKYSFALGFQGLLGEIFVVGVQCIK